MTNYTNDILNSKPVILCVSVFLSFKKCIVASHRLFLCPRSGDRAEGGRSSYKQLCQWGAHSGGVGSF